MTRRQREGQVCTVVPQHKRGAIYLRATVDTLFPIRALQPKDGTAQHIHKLCLELSEAPQLNVDKDLKMGFDLS